MLCKNQNGCILFCKQFHCWLCKWADVSLQIGVGLWGNSDALVADGMHTFLDLVMDGITYSCRFASRPPDQYLAYGYKRRNFGLSDVFVVCNRRFFVMYESFCA